MRSTPRIVAQVLGGLVFGLAPFVYVDRLVDPVLLPQFLLLALAAVAALPWISAAGTGDSASEMPGLPKWPLRFGTLFIGFVWLSLIQALSLPTALYEALRWSFMACLFLLFLRSLHSHSDFLPSVLKALVIGSLLQASLGLIHWLPYIPSPLSLPTGSHANSNLFGLAFLFALPFLVLAAFRLKGLWRYLAILACLLAVAMAYSSGSRAAALSLLLILLVLCPIFLVQRAKISHFSRYFLLLLLPIGVAAWFGMRHSFKQKVSSNNFELLWMENPRLAPSSSSLDHRMALWNRTGKMWAQDPLWGVGAGNWKLNIQAWGFQSFDEHGNYGADIPQRAHNFFLQLAAEIGLPGLLCFLALLAMALARCFRMALGPDRESFLKGAVLLGFWIAFVVACTFNFPMERPFHCSLFLLALALSFSDASPVWTFKRKALLSFSIPISIAFALFCVARISGELDYKAAKERKAKGDWAGLLEETSDRSNWFAPIDPESGAPLEWFAGMAALGLEQYELGLEKMEQARKKAPYHIAVRGNLAGAYFLNDRFEEARKEYGELLVVFPDFDEARLNLAVTFFKMGEYEEAQANLILVEGMVDDSRYLALKKQLEDLSR